MPEIEQGAPTPPRRRIRPEALFLLKFLGLLAVFFLAVAPKPMNERLVEPFTGLVAKGGGVFLNLLGQDVRMVGTAIVSARFGVNIRNGCNGLETVFIFAAAVLAFPAPWKKRLAGLVAGTVLIQAFNLVRIASLFLIGVFFPKLFEESHIVVWQILVILFGVAIFLVWADRFALPPRSTSPEPRP